VPWDHTAALAYEQRITELGPQLCERMVDGGLALVQQQRGSRDVLLGQQAFP
jgi:hypothetical protein